MSSGTPSRLSGYAAVTSSSRPSYSLVANRVFTTAGATPLTRMSGPSSTAINSVSEFSIALLAP